MSALSVGRRETASRAVTVFPLFARRSGEHRAAASGFGSARFVDRWVRDPLRVAPSCRARRVPAVVVPARHDRRDATLGSRRTSRRASSFVRAAGEPVAPPIETIAHARGHPRASRRRVRAGEPVEPIRPRRPRRTSGGAWPGRPPTAEARRSPASPRRRSPEGGRRRRLLRSPVDRRSDRPSHPRGAVTGQRPKSTTGPVEATVACLSRRDPSGEAPSGSGQEPARAGRWHRTRRFARMADVAVE